MKTVLGAIRDSLSRAVLPEADYQRPMRRLETRFSAHSASLRGAPQKNLVSQESAADAESLRARFTVEAQALTVQVHAVSNRAEAIDLLLGIVQGCAAEAVIAWDEEHLPLPEAPTQQETGVSRRAKNPVSQLSSGVWETLRAAGVQVLDSALPQDGTARMARLADLDRAAVGVTGALAGLADTGSLALASGPGRGRLASLLPPVLIVLLPVTSLYPSMAAFFTDHPDVARQASNLVFITGPSRTADIEQTLTLGVHGPREVHVIFLEV